MNFLRLNDYLLTILFQDSEIIALDKPYGLTSHTNDSKVGNEDFIHEGLIEIYEKQLGQRLYIVHRLDQTTTGVIIFAKTPEAAKKYAAFFFDRKVKKTYLFITAKKSIKTEFNIDQPIIHKGKELTAQTDFSLIKKTSTFQLWQARPLTGRNHQIRIHAQAGDISILGDAKYGGDAFAFLCLHNRRIEFPNGIVIESQPPMYFEDLNLIENFMLVKILFDIDRRQRLFGQFSASKECFRLVHQKSDERNTGVTLDQLGENWVLYSYHNNLSESDQKTFQQLSKIFNKPLLIRFRPEGKSVVGHPVAPVLPSAGAALQNSWMAEENKIKYELRMDAGQSFGLFVDQRLQRYWVLKNSSDKKVLNLFSYTGGFSLAAALGKAKEVTSVDTNKNVLAWSKKNFELNQLDLSHYKFLCRDSLEFLEQNIKKNSTFDLIICDPPAFSRGEKAIFKIETHLEKLLKGCLLCLSAEGTLLFSTHFEGFFIDDIRRTIEKLKIDLKLKHLQISLIQSGLDFELIGKKTILKSFMITKKQEEEPLALVTQCTTDLLTEED
ncbi:MAG: class I SAM-dependent methyltransferase [Bdellovibrionaceae bacterium]|nr:class I SAM-dependent methyltransferase [Bdellovibrio sp.]